MLHRLHRLERSSLIYCGLGLAAIIGWGNFAHATWSARQLSRDVRTITTERDKAIADRKQVQAKYEQLQRSAGELKQLEAKLDQGNVELNRTVRAWAAAQQKLATLNRLEATKDGVSQTGSIRKTAPPKPLAR